MPNNFLGSKSGHVDAGFFSSTLSCAQSLRKRFKCFFGTILVVPFLQIWGDSPKLYVRENEFSALRVSGKTSFLPKWGKIPQNVARAKE